MVNVANLKMPGWKGVGIYGCACTHPVLRGTVEEELRWFVIEVVGRLEFVFL